MRQFHMKIVNDINSNYSIYHLKRREFRSSYVNIPLSIKMKTNEIGYFTYFGEVGTMFGLKLSQFDQIRMSIADSMI